MRLFRAVVLAVAGSAVVPSCAFEHPAAASDHRGVGLTPAGAFEENGGQFEAEVRLACQASAYTAVVTSTELVVSMADSEQIFRFPLTEAGEARPFGLLPAPMRYFTRAGSSFRDLDVALYAGVRFENVEPGVDLELYCGRPGLEYRWIQRGHRSNSDLKLPWTGAEMVIRPPEAPGGREPASGMRSYKALSERHVSTVIGGGLWDSAHAIAADSTGNLYVTGETWSSDFPGAVRTAGFRGKNVFIAKLNSTGDTLLYTAIIGGSGDDTGTSIKVDASGGVFVAGTTDSADFPVTSGAAGLVYKGVRDGFILKLDSRWQIVFATYLGGGGEDAITGIAVDARGAVYATGYTASRNFVVSAGALQGTHAGGFYDAFVTKLSPNGTAFEYSTYLGGTSTDTARAIAVDASGCAYVTGATDSLDFPARSALQSLPAGGGDAFVAKVNPAGTALLLSTYLGGRSLDYGTAIAVDAAGTAYITGPTFSQDFPMAATALRRANRGAYDLFVAAIAPNGLGLTASTYLGGSESEEPAGLEVDSGGSVYVAGYTRSADFLMPDEGTCVYHGGEDAFIVKLAGRLDKLLYAECLGGSGNDRATGIVIDSTGQPFVAGGSASTDFPGQRIGANGAGDAFVVKAGRQNYTPVTVSVTPGSGKGWQQTFQFRVADPDGATDMFGMMISIGTAPGAARACLLFYDRANGIIALADDASNFRWAGRLGTAATIDNNQCSIALSGSTATSSGPDLTLTVPIHFKSTVNGRQSIYLFTQDRAGAYAGWDQRGWWDAVPENQPPTTLPATPSSGSGPGGSFTFAVADPDGFADLFGMMVLITETGSFANACALFYDRSSGVVALANDPGTAFTTAGLLASQGALQNSQCTVALDSSYATNSGTDVKLTLRLQFKKSFAGKKSLLAFTQDKAGLYAGWDQRGVWTVTTFNSSPATVPVVPPSGSGLAQAFTFSVSDPDGSEDLPGMMVLISGTGSLAGACALFYDRTASIIALANDAGSAFTVAGRPGTQETLQNNQCSIALSGATVSSSGTTLNLTVPISFKAAFRGGKSTFLFTQDRLGAYAGWDLRGTWTVP